MAVMLRPTARRFFDYFASAYPARTVRMIFLFVGAGLADGVGIAGLLPVLELSLGQTAAEQSDISQAVGSVLNAIGLPTTLPVLLGVVVSAISLKGVFKWLAMREAGFVTARVGMDLRLRLIRSVMRADWEFFVSRPTGHFSNAISSEAHRAAMGYREACAALAGLIQVTVYAGFVVLISWQVALAALVAGGAILFALRKLVTAARHAGVEQARTMRDLVARLTEALPGIKPVKSMAREPFLLPLLERETEGYNTAQRKQVAAVESMLASQEPILVAVLAIGLGLTLSFTSTPFPSVLVLAFLFWRLVGGLNQSQHRYQSMSTGEGAFLSIEALIWAAEKAEEAESGRLLAPDQIVDGVEFHGVSFSYGDHQVLHDVQIEIPSGQFVAIVGPSGSGKTTLVDLLTGLLTPAAGQILVDGVDLAKFDRQSWREGLGYVPQELLLFHDSIRRNVTLGNDSIPDDEVEHALRAAGAWPFVLCLPDVLDHTIGERGGKLSGGQRQRIAIARALVERPRLLILDEATTALDPETEAAICQTLTELKKEVTIVAISHQAAMREVADIVYEVEGGSVRQLSAGRSA